MNCIHTDCTIFSSCKIKEVAHHCIIHKRMCFAFGNTVQKDAEFNVNSQQGEHETGEKVGNNNRES